MTRVKLGMHMSLGDIRTLDFEDFAVTATPVVTEEMVRRNIVQVEEFEDLDVQVGDTEVNTEE